jgi:hypothetical protein
MHCLTWVLLAFFLISMSVTSWQIYVIVDYTNHNRGITCNILACRIIGIGHCFRSNCYEVLMTYSAIIPYIGIGTTSGGITHNNTSLFSISGDDICDHNTTKCYYNEYKSRDTFSIFYPAFPDVSLLLLSIILFITLTVLSCVWSSYSDTELVREYL